MSNWGSKLKDKISTAASGSSSTKSVIKATYHNTKPPKEKHVRKLLLLVHEGSARTADVLTQLAERLQHAQAAGDWLVAGKSLVVIHRLMRDASGSFNTEARRQAAMLAPLKHFSDTSTPEAQQQSVFIRKYSQYIEECAKFRQMIDELERTRGGSLKALTIDEAFEHVPQLQSQLNAMLNCKSCKEHIAGHPIPVTAFTLMLKDSFRLYRLLNDALIVLLENYFSMPRAQAAKALDIYKLFVRETDGTIQFFDICRRFVKSDLPELQHAPITLVEALENYIKELDSGATPSQAPRSNNNAGRQATTAVTQQLQLLDLREETVADPTAEDSDSDDTSRSSGSTASFQQSSFHPAASSRAPSAVFDPFGLAAPPSAAASRRSSSPAPAFDPFGDFSTPSSSSTSTRNLSPQQPASPQLPTSSFAAAPPSSNPFGTDPFGSSFAFDAAFPQLSPQQSSFEQQQQDIKVNQLKAQILQQQLPPPLTAQAPAQAPPPANYDALRPANPFAPAANAPANPFAPSPAAGFSSNPFAQPANGAFGFPPPAPTSPQPSPFGNPSANPFAQPPANANRNPFVDF
eukprot:TRINITY_DN10796_c0_g1_i1.p1 TRINITY_DN10796_c0_g1~~TRINITY_DN10796_c0_g1_i1.p1  ORF type:complete len:575 (+),score=291.49 TRINITY_DN10796_c0_g1_i1:141-1865(+)